jgi:hypothetical protein
MGRLAFRSSACRELYDAKSSSQALSCRVFASVPPAILSQDATYNTYREFSDTNRDDEQSEGFFMVKWDWSGTLQKHAAREATFSIQHCSCWGERGWQN